jgi:hypothetical protein
MAYNYTVKYRTFDELLSDVQVDFQNLSLQNMIEPQQLLKVAKRVTYDLGLRVMMTKEAILDVCNDHVKLPDDFYTLNYALVCDDLTVHEAVSQGTHITEQSVIPQYHQTPDIISSCTDGTVNCQSCGVPSNTCACQVNPSNCPVLPEGQSYCVKPKIQMNCKGEAYELVQIVNTQSRTYKRLWPLQMLTNDQSIECGCPNLYVKSPTQGWIKDNFLFTNLGEGKVYISYQGAMEDDQGNLLVVDHPEINEYYEYAVKQRILENLLMNDENVTAKLNLVEQRLRQARNISKSIVNTPNFSEMKALWEANRKAQYAKYYDQFKSYSQYSDFGRQNGYQQSNRF